MAEVTNTSRLQERPDPSALLVDAFRQIAVKALVDCLDAGDAVAATYPPEKAKDYMAGFSAAIIAVTLRFGISDVEIRRGSDGRVTDVIAR